MTYTHLAKNVSGELVHRISSIGGDRDQLHLKWTDGDGQTHDDLFSFGFVGAIETWLDQTRKESPPVDERELLLIWLKRNQGHLAAIMKHNFSLSPTYSDTPDERARVVVAGSHLPWEERIDLKDKIAEAIETAVNVDRQQRP